MRGFRIAELARRTGTAKETIHYYLRIGLLRKPEKTSKNMAYYDEGHVEQLKLIRKLRTESYLPLAVIKKLMREGEIATAQSKVDLAGDLFYESPGSEVKLTLKDSEDEAKPLIKPERLEAYREAGLMLPRKKGEDFDYGWEDLRIAEILASAEEEAGDDAEDFVIERFQVLEKHIKRMVRDESAHFFASLISTQDPKMAMSILQGGRDTIGRYLALSRVRRLRYEIESLLKEVEGVLKNDRPDARPVQTVLPLSKAAKSKLEASIEATTEYSNRVDVWVSLLNFLLDHGMDTEAVEYFDGLPRKFQEEPSLAILGAEGMMEIRRHDDALSILVPMRETPKTSTAGVYLLMSASILGRLRDRLLISALGDEQTEEPNTSSPQIISDLVEGLSLLYRSRDVASHTEGFRAKRYRYIQGRIQLAMPPFLGRAEEGQAIMRALLEDLEGPESDLVSEYERLSWNVLKALASRSPDKSERMRMNERASQIEARIAAET